MASALDWKAFDWTRTGFGPRESWPPALRVLMDTCLESKFPLLLTWGQDLRVAYNDAYIPLLGPQKHPWALGRPAAEVWPDVFGENRRSMEELLRTGGAVYREDHRVIMIRNGHPEETFFTYSQSAVRDENGQIAGLLTTVTETTAHMLYERRLRVLHALGTVRASVAGAADPVAASCRRAVDVLSTNRASVPFALVFLRDEADRPRLVHGYGFDPETATLRGWLPVPPVQEVFEVLAGGPVRVLSGLRERFGEALRPGPLGPVLPDQAVLLPILAAGHAKPVGVLAIGVNAYREVDEPYLEFAELAGRQFGIIVSEALAYRQERDELRELSELDQVKTQFQEQVSHELRHPLTLLLPPLRDLLADPEEQLSPQARSSVDAAVRAAMRLEHLVDALLLMARADDGMLEPDLRDTDIVAATAQVAEDYRSAAVARGLELIVRRPPGAVIAAVDPSMWAAVVTNLIGNAIKYTDAGTVTVALTVEGASVLLAVGDTGIGVSASDQERIFDRFVQGDTRRNGVGLGLALVKHIVEAHGGSIAVASRPGAGSTFTVTVPSAVLAELPPAGEPAAVSDLGQVDHPDVRARGDDFAAGSSPEPVDAATERPALLLVEDDPDLAGYLRRLFERNGWAVHHVADAEAALAALVSGGGPDHDVLPDAVLTDVMLPGQSGLDLITVMRHDPRLERIPAIVLTARAGPAAAVEALAAGANDYLTKPFDSAELVARVGAHHELNQVRESAIERAETAAGNLRTALATNRTIGAAIGIVMARYLLDHDSAFQELVRISQQRNRKLRDVAADTVETGALPEPPAPTDQESASPTARQVRRADR